MLSKEILGLVQRGMKEDAAAIRELCEVKWPDILYICVKAIGNWSDGQDVAQEVMVKLVHSLPKLRRAENFPAWLNRIIANTCADHYKRNEQKPELTLDMYPDSFVEENVGALPVPQTEKSERQDMILEAIDELPYKCRLVVVMHYYEGLTVKEISHILKQPEQSIRNILQRSKTKLHESLEVHRDELLYSAAIPPVLLVSALQAEAQAMGALAGAAPVIATASAASTGKGAFLFGIARLPKIAAAAIGGAAAVASFTVAIQYGLSPPGSPAAGMATSQAYPQEPLAVMQAVGEPGEDIFYESFYEPEKQPEAEPAIQGAVLGPDGSPMYMMGLTVCLYLGDECVLEAAVNRQGEFAFYEPPVEEGQPFVLQVDVPLPDGKALQGKTVVAAGSSLQEATIKLQPIE